MSAAMIFVAGVSASTAIDQVYVRNEPGDAIPSAVCCVLLLVLAALRCKAADLG